MLFLFFQHQNCTFLVDPVDMIAAKHLVSEIAQIDYIAIFVSSDPKKIMMLISA